MSHAVIEVRDLVKRYKKAEKNAVDGVSFSVQPGEFFALLGPNGAGKTTTISILTTTLAPTSGQVLIGGADAVKDSAAVRRQVGIIFQKPSIDRNLSGEENVRFHAILYGLYPYRPMFQMMPETYRRQVHELAELLDLGKEIFKPLKKMSGGMMRKLEIIRGLMHRPKVLFLDEPTAGLDAASRRNLWDYLKGVRAESDTTVFLTTHYLDEAEEADRICILDKGKVVKIGTPDAIKADLLQEYLVLDSADRTALRRDLAGRRPSVRDAGPSRLHRDRRGAAHFGVGLSDALVGIGLLGLQLRADVVADIDVGDVDRENLERRPAIESFLEDELRDAIGIFEHVLVGVGRADRGHDSLPHPRDDRLLRRAADEAIEMRTDGDARFYFHADAILRDAIDRGPPHRGARDVDDLRVDARAHRFEYGLAGVLGRQIDRAGAIEIE